MMHTHVHSAPWFTRQPEATQEEDALVKHTHTHKQDNSTNCVVRTGFKDLSHATCRVCARVWTPDWSSSRGLTSTFLFIGQQTAWWYHNYASKPTSWAGREHTAADAQVNEDSDFRFSEQVLTKHMPKWANVCCTQARDRRGYLTGWIIENTFWLIQAVQLHLESQMDSNEVFFCVYRCGNCLVLSGVTHYLCPGWKMRHWSCASSQNLFPDSWIVNKVRLLHFSSGWTTFLSRAVFPPLSCLLLRWWVLRRETLGCSGSLFDRWQD